MTKKHCDYLTPFFMEQIWTFYSPKLKKEKTRSDYFYNVCSAAEYLECDFIQIDVAGAKRFFTYLREQKKLSVKSMYTKLCSLRSVAAYIYSNRVTLGIPWYVNPFLSVSVDSYDAWLSPEDVPSKNDLDRLLEAAADDDCMFLVLSLVIRCSLTASQICRLSPNMFAVDATAKCFITIQEYNRCRYVYVPDDVVELVDAYVTEHDLQHRDHLFYNQNGNPLQKRPLQKRMLALSSAAGFVSNSITLQDVRNASIALMLYGGAPVDSVAKHAGISEQWMYRYNRVIEDIQDAPCTYMHLEIKK